MKRIIKFMLGFLTFIFIISIMGIIFVEPPVLLGNYVNGWFATLLIITGPLFGYCLERFTETKLMDKLIDFMEG